MPGNMSSSRLKAVTTIRGRRIFSALHLKSGIRPELIAELHGNMTKMRCKRCEQIFDKDGGFEKCPCGGRLVSSVVDFGQSLPEKDLSLAFEHSQLCDLFIVVGSSVVSSNTLFLYVITFPAKELLPLYIITI